MILRIKMPKLELPDDDFDDLFKLLNSAKRGKSVKIKREVFQALLLDHQRVLSHFRD